MQDISINLARVPDFTHKNLRIDIIEVLVLVLANLHLYLQVSIVAVAVIVLQALYKQGYEGELQKLN
jgi:hypothetical protein